MSLEQALSELTAAIKTLTDHASSITQPSLPLQDTPKPKVTRKKKEEAPVEVPKVEAEELKAEVEETLAEYTVDEVRKKLQPIVQEQGPGKVQSALAELGAQNLSSLDPKDFAKLLGMVTGG